MDVIEFQVSACRATVAVGAHERALSLVSLPNGAPYVRWNVPLPDAGAGAPRPGRSSELLPLQLKDQGFQRPIEHLRDVPAGHRVTQQSLRISQFLVRLAVDRHPEAVALRWWLGWSD
jgi:hypothetical protein